MRQVKYPMVTEVLDEAESGAAACCVAVARLYYSALSELAGLKKCSMAEANAQMVAKAQETFK